MYQPSHPITWTLLAAALPLTVALSLIAAPAHADDRPRRNIVSVALGPAFAPTEYTVWMGDPADRWAKRTPGFSFMGAYQRRLHALVSIGGYLELESFGLERGGASVGGTRYGTGAVFLARYPDRMLAFEAGGTFGLGIVEVDEGRVMGIDYGLFFGPAFQYRWLGLALHGTAMRGWYPGGSLLEEMSVDQLRVRLELRLLL